MVRSAGSTSYNFDNPVIRDVVSIGTAGDEVTIRFFTDNPGPWFFHCHIDWHLNASVVLSGCFADQTDQCASVVALLLSLLRMSLIYLRGSNLLVSSYPPPGALQRSSERILRLEAWNELCPAYDAFINGTSS